MAIRPWILALLVVAISLAGCAADPPQEAQAPNKIVAKNTNTPTIPSADRDMELHSLKEIKPFAINTGDGVTLRGSLYVPDGPGPFATILQYSPYFGSVEATTEKHEQLVDGRRTMTGFHQRHIDEGFAVALVNLRGTGESDGCFQFGGPAEWEDGRTVIDAIAAQSWSNGRVGMVGGSYDGWSQYLTITNQPEALKAIVPISSVIDLHSLLTRNGAPISIGPAVNTAWWILTSAAGGSQTGRSGVGHYPCEQYPMDWYANLELIWNGDRTAFFETRDYRPFIDNATVPMLITNGMTDGEGHILQFENLWPLMSEQRLLLIGQWGHAIPTGNALGVDFWDLEVAWFDHYLRDGPKLIETGVVQYQDDQGAWYIDYAWPPPGTPTTVFLSDGEIVAAADAVKPSSHQFASGIGDPHPSQCLPTQALWVSPPLKETIRLAGNFFVDLTLTSNLPDGNFAAYLYRSTEDAACPNVDAVEVRHALTDLRHWKSEKGTDFPVNVPTPVSLKSHPFATVVPAGSRLILAVGGDSVELLTDARKPVLSVTTGSDLPGSITLPVVEGTLAFD